MTILQECLTILDKKDRELQLERSRYLDLICTKYGITKENASLLTKIEKKINGGHIILIKLKSDYTLQEDTFLEITEQVKFTDMTIELIIKDKLIKQKMSLREIDFSEILHKPKEEWTQEEKDEFERRWKEQIENPKFIPN